MSERSVRVISAAALGLAAAASGAWGLAHQGLWPDEAFGVYTSQLDLSTLFRVVALDDSNNALYYTLLHFWQYWGASEAWLRLPSVGFGVATVVALFALNHRLFGLSTALISGVLLVVNLFFIRYMQEARVYTLALFLVVMATYCLIIALDRPSIRRWMVYGVVGAAAIYAHVLTGFVLAAHLVSLAIRRNRPPFGLVFGALFLTAVLLSPLGALMLATGQAGPSFIPTPGVDSFTWLFLHLTGGGGIASRGTNLLLLVYFVVCCAAVVAMVRAYIDRRERQATTAWSYALMLLWLAVPVLSIFVISFARPIFYPRYLIFVLPALVTIAAIGIAALPHLALRTLAVGVLLVLASPPLRAYYGTSVREGGDWRAAAEYVAQRKQPGDRVVFLSRYGRKVIEYYLDRLQADGELVPLYPQQPWGAYHPFLDDHNTESTAATARHLRDVRRVWVFLVWGGFESKVEDATPIRLALDDGFEPVAARVFGPSVEARLYERKDR